MKPPRAPLFLHRETYRRRRIMDAARILPVIGFVLILLPVLWTQGRALSTAAEAVYLFILWLLLVLAAALLSRPLRAALTRDAEAAERRHARGREEEGAQDAGSGGRS